MVDLASGDLKQLKRLVALDRYERIRTHQTSTGIAQTLSGATAIASSRDNTASNDVERLQSFLAAAMSLAVLMLRQGPRRSNSLSRAHIMLQTSF